VANFRLTNALRSAAANQIRNLVDAGATGGTIKIYTASQPATADDALTGQTLLGTLTFSTTSAPDATNGVLTFSAITEDTTADATGVAVWARIQDSNGVNVFDCDVGTAGATINLNTVNIVAGGAIRITSAVVTVPAG
jgi:hypothetical protein